MGERKGMTTVPVSVRRLAGDWYRVLTTYGTIKCLGADKTLKCLDNLFVEHQLTEDKLRKDALYCWVRCDLQDFVGAARSYGAEWGLAPGSTATG